VVPVLGNITGAIAGVLGKTAIKKELRERTAALVAEHAAKRIAAGTSEAIAKREAASLGQQFLTRSLQREIGSLGALGEIELRAGRAQLIVEMMDQRIFLLADITMLRLDGFA
jgi:hypothetical protein